jgi:hypothetical protein
MMTSLEKSWRHNGHNLKIEVRLFENEAGHKHKGLVGTMDGHVKQWTMNQFRADWPTFLEIEHYLESHAAGTWGKTPAEITEMYNGR